MSGCSGRPAGRGVLGREPVTPLVVVSSGGRPVRIRPPVLSGEPEQLYPVLQIYRCVRRVKPHRSVAEEPGDQFGAHLLLVVLVPSDVPRQAVSQELVLPRCGGLGQAEVAEVAGPLLPISKPGADRSGGLGTQDEDLVRRDDRIRVGEAVLPPGMQKLAYASGVVIGPLLPAASGEGIPGLFQPEQGTRPTGDQYRGELRQDALQHGGVIGPVNGRPGPAQEIRFQFRVRRLQKGWFVRTAPMAFAVALVLMRGHSAGAEGDGDVVQGGAEAVV